MPAKKKLIPNKPLSESQLFDPPNKNPVSVPGPHSLPKPVYARIGNKAVVEFTKFGALMLARCEDDSMYLMQGNGQWVSFAFEILAE